MTTGAMRNLWLLFAIFMLGLVGAVVYSSMRNESEPAKSEGGEVLVRVVMAKRLAHPAPVRLTGELVAAAKIDVASRLPGHVTEVRFKPGDYVTAGALLATVRSADLEERLAELESSIVAAKDSLRERDAEAADAEKRMAKDRELIARDLIARRDEEQSAIVAETARAQFELARAHLAHREAMLGQARRLQALTRLAAPIDGEVSSVAVRRGQEIAAGATVLSIVPLDTLKLIAQSEGGILRPGMKARVTSTAFPGVVGHGRIVRFEAQKNSQTSEVEIDIDNRKRIWRPGAKVEASVDAAEQQDIFLVPRSAVWSENASNNLYQLAGNEAVLRPVVLGALRGDQVEIAGGLDSDAPIILDWQTIKPGMRVRPAAVPPSPRYGKPGDS
jgi:RND family efflux transporter MFP subunit